MKRAFCVILLTPLCALAQTAGRDSSNTLDSVIIEARAETVFEEDKVPFDFQVDLTNLVDIEDGITWSSIDHLTGVLPETAEPKLRLALSSQASSYFRPAPVKVFHTEFRDLSRWRLAITAGDGSLFRTLQGQGNPPETIAWDGRNESNEPLTAGAAYSYNFIAVDKAGNKRSFPGKSFTVPAFYLLQDDELIVALTESEVFERDGLRLKPNARECASEAAGLIRLFSTRNSLSVRTNWENANDFLRLVAAELILDVEQFQRSPLPLKLQEQSGVMFIHVK